MSYCTYCGSPYGDHRDHVIPISFTSFKRHYSVGEIVPACSQCNTTLGNKVITTVPERAKYLLGRYEEKYKKLLKQPEWEDWELEEMSDQFKALIKKTSIEKEIVQERLLNLSLQAGLISLES